MTGGNEYSLTIDDLCRKEESRSGRNDEGNHLNDTFEARAYRRDYHPGERSRSSARFSKAIRREAGGHSGMETTTGPSSEAAAVTSAVKVLRAHARKTIMMDKLRLVPHVRSESG